MALINGESYGWSQIKILIDTFPYAEAKAITFTASRERAMNNGIGSKATSHSNGRYTFEGSVTLSLADVESLRATAPNNDLLDMAPIDIQVAWLPKAGLPIAYQLESVLFTEDPLTVAEGDMDIPVELSFIFADKKPVTI